MHPLLPFPPLPPSLFSPWQKRFNWSRIAFYMLPGPSARVQSSVLQPGLLVPGTKGCSPWGTWRWAGAVEEPLLGFKHTLSNRALTSPL